METEIALGWVEWRFQLWPTQSSSGCECMFWVTRPGFFCADGGGGDGFCYTVCTEGTLLACSSRYCPVSPGFVLHVMRRVEQAHHHDCHSAQLHS